jgi:hypothetical protein
MRRGHHTSRVLKAMGAGQEESAVLNAETVETLEETAPGEPE